jgi:hypothetical protein
VPWDQEWISFAAGFLLLVLVPSLLIRFRFRQSLADYGLGLPPVGRRRFALLSTLALLAFGVPTFVFAARDDDIRAVYPLFRGTFDSDADFLIYQAGYLLFFVAVEFIFRGYLLFGLFGSEKDSDRDSLAVRVAGFGYAAILISMLSYTAWHLAKPQLELWGSIPWGLATGAIALASRSILLIILAHWLLNFFLDLLIWKEWLI